MAKISKDMMIGEVVQKHPETAEVFMGYGLHCVGCHVAFWETLEQGASGHGMDPETIDKMIKDANRIIEQNEDDSPQGKPADGDDTSKVSSD